MNYLSLLKQGGGGQKRSEVNLLHIILLAMVSYLLGSISFAYLAGRKLKGIDVKDYGNPGAATVYREVGPYLRIGPKHYV